jgi:Ca2+-binding RTX toxin-like protein
MLPYGGKGEDVLTGGDGHDTFYVDEHDHITDFDEHHDEIVWIA